MRSFVFGDLINIFNNSQYVAYCYKGRTNRGSIAIFNNETIQIIKPNSYLPCNVEDLIDDYSNFELWSFIHEMGVGEEEVRQEAVDRFFDVYCNLYQFIPSFQDFNYITEVE